MIDLLGIYRCTCDGTNKVTIDPVFILPDLPGINRSTQNHVSKVTFSFLSDKKTAAEEHVQRRKRRKRRRMKGKKTKKRRKKRRMRRKKMKKRRGRGRGE